jgi:P27 family predicted phage terminase small subunit
MRTPEAPASLGGVGRRIWRDAVRQLHQEGRLRTADLPIVALYAEAYEDWHEAAEKIRDQGKLMKTPTGAVVHNPWLSIRNDASRRLNDHARSLGLRPDARLEHGSAHTFQDYFD